MRCSRNNIRDAGFTLIEMLIIAPIIIIFIGVIIVMITSVTGESLQARERNTMAYQVQDALDLVELEGSRSASYPTTTGTLTSPQGSDGSTAAFTVTNNDASNTDNDVLIIKTPATTTNPTNDSKKLVYYNSPNACASADVTKNDYYPVTTVYFVASGSLWQRTILPSTGTACSTPWQRPSCAESASLTGVCKTYDNKLVSDVTSFSVQYLKGDGTALAASSAATAKAVNISITTSKLVAGKTITYNGSTRSVAMSGGTTGPTTKTFNYTGAQQTWTVPDGVSSITVECWGAEGGEGRASSSPVYGGKGGYAKGTLAVTAGETLYINVGGKGGNGHEGTVAGGFNGGGNGAYPNSSYNGAGGGGGSDVRRGGQTLADRKIVCGGGGGATNGNSSYLNERIGGDGGGSTGGATVAAGTMTPPSGGGTQTSGGSGGSWSSGSYGVGGPGSLGQGGGAPSSWPGGGGGGGYYGGGAGIYISGGGGSSYIGGVTNGTTTSGSRTGNGQIKITYNIGGDTGGGGVGTNVATFNYTGNSQTWQVPAGITTVQIEAWGAEGGTSVGGKGGYAKGNLTVTPGQTLYIYVGQAGSASTSGGISSNPFNGGGKGYTVSGGDGGGSGGGGSDVRTSTSLSSRVIVAGGGGGGYLYSGAGNPPGGNGGGASGSAGTNYPGYGSSAGGGGTQSAGGTGGYISTGASAGALGQGGNCPATNYGGGGGGGYYGGGGGDNTAGGGGSSYIGGVTGGVTTAGLRSGNGQVVITY